MVRFGGTFRVVKYHIGHLPVAVNRDAQLVTPDRSTWTQADGFARYRKLFQVPFFGVAALDILRDSCSMRPAPSIHASFRRSADVFKAFAL